MPDRRYPLLGKSVWVKWFSTASLAVVAKVNIQVDKILRPKPGTGELEYPHKPMYEPTTAEETTAEKRQRD